MKPYIKINKLNIRDMAGSDVSLQISRGEIIGICGECGSGKSSLAGYMAGIIRPANVGRVLVDGLDPFSELDEMKIHKFCGIVSQNPDDDIVFDSLLSDSVFGPENLGLDRERIAQRVGGFYKKLGLEGKQRLTYDMISGSEKQRAVLGSVLSLHPEILILDDAFSMQDMGRAKHIYDFILDLAKKRGQTVVTFSNRHWELEPCDRIFRLEKGKLTECKLSEVDSIFDGVSESFDKEPFTIEEIRGGESENPRALLQLENISFKYKKKKKAPYLFEDLSYSFYAGNYYRLRGKNGSGRSTMTQIMAGIISPGSGVLRGKVNRIGKVVLAQQYPEMQLFSDTVIEDVIFGLTRSGMNRQEAIQKAGVLLDRLRIPKDKWYKSPLLISAGEKRKVLIAGIFLSDADVIILDKPYAGLDADGCSELQELIINALADDKCVIIAE